MSDIPEFITRKLVVKESLKQSADGFSVDLHNTFAPATFLGLSVEVDGKAVLAEDVSLTPQGGESLRVSEISSQNPFPFAVGATYILSIKGVHLMEGKLRVAVETREAGAVSLSVRLKGREKASRTATKSRFPKIFNFPLRASVEVDAREVIGRISPRVYGHFIEHLERCIYDGIWTADGAYLRTDTLALISALNPPLMRYPGGNFASGYHWEDGIGPKTQRPLRTDKAWNADESNQVGTEEFMAFCRAIDSEPFLVVNDGSGSPEEAARWVEYCNAAAGEQAKRRAANGHVAPYGVRLWGAGNEVWGAWQIGTTSAENYAARLIAFADAMRAADPSIEIVAVGDKVLTDDSTDPGARWNAAVLNAAADKIDHLSFHIYHPDQAGWREHYDPENLHHTVMAAPLSAERVIQRIGAQIAAISPSRKIGVAFDEWNLWLAPPPEARSMHDLNYNLRDALYAAGMLNAFQRQCNTLSLANLAQLVNVLPLIRTDATRAVPTAMYYAFWLYQFMRELALKVELKAPAFDSDELGTIAAQKCVPYLDVGATRADSSSGLTLSLLNRHPASRIRAELGLRGFGRLQKPSRAYLLTGPSLLAVNTFEQPNTVAVREVELPDLRGEKLFVEIPASSIMVIPF
jgi:alpha-L-arabinofuranosidase